MNNAEARPVYPAAFSFRGHDLGVTAKNGGVYLYQDESLDEDKQT